VIANYQEIDYQVVDVQECLATAKVSAQQPCYVGRNSKIQRKFGLTAVQCHPKSMILVPIESA